MKTMDQSLVGMPTEHVKDLPSFMSALSEADEEPIRINRRVSAQHELGAVQKALESIDNRMIEFTQVDDSRFPVVTSVFSADQRIAIGLGLPATATPRDTLLTFHYRLDRRGSVETINDVPAHAEQLRDGELSLDLLPIGTFAEKQTRPYINSGVLLVRDPGSGNINAGIYRMMKLSDRALTVSVDPGHDLGKVLKKHRDAGTPLPFSLVIGASPLFYLASQAKNSMERDFYEVYSALAGRTIRVAEGITNDIPVPEDAEIVLEGTIEPDEYAAEGPYGEFSYYYGSDSRAEVCGISCISHKTDAKYLDIHPVHNDHRNLWLHPGREESLLRRLKALLPSVADVTIPTLGAGMLCVIAMEKQHEGDPKRALHFALVSDMFLKHAIIVDADVDIRDHRAVIWALCTRFQPKNDVFIPHDLRGYSEDPSGYELSPGTGRLTSKIGYDATRALGGSFPEDATGIPLGFEALKLEDYLET